MQKANFFDFGRVSLLRSKKHSLLSRISKYVSFLLCLLKKKHIRKRSIFWEKPWTNPFAKSQFFWLCRNLTFQVWKAFFTFQNIKNWFFLAFFAQKKNMRKKSIFWQKPWTNPFAKCRFFSTLWELHFWGPKKPLFSIRNITKILFSGFFCLKKTYKKKVDFLTKTTD